MANFYPTKKPMACATSISTLGHSPYTWTRDWAAPSACGVLPQHLVTELLLLAEPEALDLLALNALYESPPPRDLHGNAAFPVAPQL
jgi:hypothetical protein